MQKLITKFLAFLYDRGRNKGGKFTNENKKWMAIAIITSQFSTMLPVSAAASVLTNESTAGQNTAESTVPG